MEDDFKLLEWQGLSIIINGEYITHLRFADDIIVMASRWRNSAWCLMASTEFHNGWAMGLKINMYKTIFFFKFQMSVWCIILFCQNLPISLNIIVVLILTYIVLIVDWFSHCHATVLSLPWALVSLPCTHVSSPWHEIFKSLYLVSFLSYLLDIKQEYINYQKL